MKDLSTRRAGQLLLKWVSEGEHENQDFKFTVNDPVKIARSISAFANNSGGRLLIGVDDNKNIRGVKSEEDIYVVEAAAQIYCKPACEIEFTGYKASGGALVIKAEIAESKTKPVLVKENGTHNAYYRVKDENILAPPLMVKSWKYQSKPSNNITFTPDRQKLEILRLLELEELTFEELIGKVTISKATLERTVIELIAMRLVDFVFKNRKFHLTTSVEH